MEKLEPGHLDKKILILDDDPNIVRLLRRFLEQRGYTRVMSASTVKEGSEKLQQEPPDVVLLDFQLPDGNGLEVLEEIKRSNPKIGVIMITGVGDDDVGRKAMRLGAFHFFYKPFDIDYLDRALWLQLKTMSTVK